MYVHLYRCIYVCMYVYIHLCIYVHMLACMHVVFFTSVFNFVNHVYKAGASFSAPSSSQPWAMFQAMSSSRGRYSEYHAPMSRSPGGNCEHEKINDVKTLFKPDAGCCWMLLAAADCCWLLGHLARCCRPRRRLRQASS